MIHPAYHHRMKRTAALTIVLLGLSSAAFAQHGGGGHVSGGASHGFSGGGFSGARSAPSFRGSYAARPNYAVRPTYATRPHPYAVRPNYPNAARYGAANGGGRRPAFYNRRDGRGYDPGISFGLGYPYGLGYIDTGLYDYDDSALYDGSGQTPDNSYVAQGPGNTYPDGVMPPPPQAATRLQPAPAPEQAITLIFKDGRPPLQIHNYALTRTTLYVTDAHHRDIPVADLDLPATQKANDDAGVTFTLPTAQ